MGNKRMAVCVTRLGYQDVSLTEGTEDGGNLHISGAFRERERGWEIVSEGRWASERERG